jgi:hypothetical protein
MNIDFAFVCDYADGTSGKISAIGIGFDTIHAPQVPFKHRLFFLVVKLRASIVETGEKEVKIALIDDDGVSVIPDLVSKINIPKPVSGTESKANLVLQFDNVEFPKYGNYELKLVISGVEMGSIQLHIAHLPVNVRK